ncbi:MAG: ThiF family adenylyltransferase [Halioglobus sp.]|jgi:molybdopterin-synthase adenylyltransferase
MEHDLARYHRQMLLPGFGEAGQRRLLASTVLILGCGALGSIAADMLVRAGVGHIVLIDRDFPEIHNLQRQVLFDEADVEAATPKAVAAQKKLARINSQVRITAVVEDVNRTNIAAYARGVDLILDGLDNFETRYLANDFAVKYGLPYLYGAAVGMTGMAFPVLPHTQGGRDWETGPAGNFATPCLRCLFEEAPPPGTLPTCDTVGVLSSAVALVANFQVAEALKILTGNFAHVSRTLLNLDLWANDIQQLDVSNVYDEGDCPCCRHHRFDYLDGDAGSNATVLCGRDSVQLQPGPGVEQADLAAVARRLSSHGPVHSNDYLLRAQLVDGEKAYEITLFANGRTMVKGTADTGVARGIYAKYVGV